MANESFFNERSVNSEVKTKIVTEYFGRWSRVVLPWAKMRGKQIAYVDLYAGPGRYKDGSATTPIKILEIALKDPDLSENLVTLFNDKNVEFSKMLESEISNLVGITKLQNKPVVMAKPVDETFSKYFNQNKIIPTFSFIDPWGYKGLSLQIVRGVIKDWGCDSVLFFNYNRVQSAIVNSVVEERMVELFGERRLNELKKRIKGSNHQEEKQSMILEEFSQALKEQGVEYVLPFQFENLNRKVTHHLIFISKHFRGYDIMKHIMAKESSSKNGDVASFSYTVADETFPLLFSLQRRDLDLKKLLTGVFTGQSLTLQEVYEKHSVDRPFTEWDYRNKLLEMEKNKEVTVITTVDKPRRKGSLPKHCKIKFNI